MGGLTQALARAATASASRSDARPRWPASSSGRPRRRVVLANGEELRAPLVVSNADANVTFTRLVEARELPAEFLAAVGRISYASASLKINVAPRRAADFRAVPGTRPGPSTGARSTSVPTSTISSAPFDDAKYAGLPRAGARVHHPLGGGRHVAPAGRHLMSIFVQYAPYALGEGHWDQFREPFADRCFALLDEYAPNFSRSVLARQVLTPLDIERTFNLTGAISFRRDDAEPAFPRSARAGPCQLPDARPRLYLCGAATHPGGGVSWAPGLQRGPRDPTHDRRPWGSARKLGGGAPPPFRCLP
jgi:phytoene dehydrogenase-like protein